ncbi:tRNA-dihydrouridine synthase family protein [Prolixibacteraceae bacterium JC049]|nr:tRNA-dihydrouridine synthase family protein [Prolixibacteraceae bacterium JC049]
MIDSNFKIYQAPLQGLTDFTFRNVHHKYFNHIDEYFTPYLVFENDGSIKKSRLNEVVPENNTINNLTPQVLVKDAAETVRMLQLLTDYGYNSVNFNLGCPYPMVTKRGRGSALLQHPEAVNSILEAAFAHFQGTVSVKMRCGLVDFAEQTPVLEVLNQFQLSNLFLHPRIGKQLYKGTPNIEAFMQARDIYQSEIVYNGDINSAEDMEQLQSTIGTASGLMIGRGLLQNPQLPEALKEAETNIDADKLRSFHEELFVSYQNRLSGDSHLLQKMRQFWEYFCMSFPNSRKVFKSIKKANNLEQYWQAVQAAFSLFY